MKFICKMLSGSRLYGCSTLASDYDYKGVYLASLDEILRGQTAVKTCKDEGISLKVEEEYFHIQQFMHLLAKQESVPLSMLFTPPEFWVEVTPVWERIHANRRAFVSSNIAAIAGYARSQAQKYSLRGARLHTLIDFKKDLDTLNTPDNRDRDNCFLPEVFESLCKKYEGMSGVRVWTHTREGVSVRMIEVCGKSFGETTPAKLWFPPLDKLLSNFGERSKEAMMSNNQDLKAMYHAVRIISEGIELLSTMEITYPRPEAPLLLDIRNGKLTADEVADLIDDRFDELNRLEANPGMAFQSHAQQKEFCAEMAIHIQREALEAEVRHSDPRDMLQRIPKALLNFPWRMSDEQPHDGHHQLLG